jgi:hypothetical protein
VNGSATAGTQGAVWWALGAAVEEGTAGVVVGALEAVALVAGAALSTVTVGMEVLLGSVPWQPDAAVSPRAAR